MVEQSMARTQEKPVFFLDLAVPRDIAPDVAELPYAHLYNIDDLHVAIKKGLDERQTAAIHAETLITPTLEEYLAEDRIRTAKKDICGYREHMKHLAALELQKATKKIDSGLCQQTVMHEFSEKLLNKVIHATTVGLRQAAADGRSDILEFTDYLLNINASCVETNEEIT